MLIKFGSIVTDGSGKLGGHIYSKNRGGNYIRTNQIPSNPRTPHQMLNRAYLTFLSQQWSSLTANQIAAWNEATHEFPRTNRFGDKKFLSGKNLFTSLNKNLLGVGLNILQYPPAPGEAAIPVSILPELDLDPDFLFELDVEWDNTPHRVVIVATPPMSRGISNYHNRLRIIKGGDPTTSNFYRIENHYNARFGTPQSGQKIAVGLYSVNASGQRTVTVTREIIVP